MTLKKGEAIYGIGGAAIGALAGYLGADLLRKKLVPSDIQKQAERITAFFVLDDGTEDPMTMKVLTRYGAGDLPVVLYAFYSPNGDINGLMSVYIVSSTVNYQCAKQCDSAVTFYHDDILMLTISGGAANRKEYAV